MWPAVEPKFKQNHPSSIYVAEAVAVSICTIQKYIHPNLVQLMEGEENIHHTKAAAVIATTNSRDKFNGKIYCLRLKVRFDGLKVHGRARVQHISWASSRFSYLYFPLRRWYALIFVVAATPPPVPTSTQKTVPLRRSISFYVLFFC